MIPRGLRREVISLVANTLTSWSSVLASPVCGQP
jgi:hypothetical protein